MRPVQPKTGWPEDAVLANRSVVRLDQAPGRGAEKPTVHLVLFSDFECPYCAAVETTLNRLLREHPNELRIYFRHNPMPFHKQAGPASEAAIEAFAQGGEAKFWAMHDRLFENTQSLSKETILRLAKETELETKTLQKALGDHRHLKQVAFDQKQAEELGANGTPTSFINGRAIVGAQPYEVFKAVIDEEIAWANQALQNGVAREELYQNLMQDVSRRLANVDK